MKHIKSFQIFESKKTKKSPEIKPKNIVIPKEEIEMAQDMALSMTPEEAEDKAKELEKGLIAKGFDVHSALSAMDKEKDPEKAIERGFEAAARTNVVIEESFDMNLLLYLALAHMGITAAGMTAINMIQDYADKRRDKKSDESEKKAEDYVKGNAYMKSEYLHSKSQGDRRNMGIIVRRIKNWAKSNISSRESDIDRFVRDVINQMES
jgi:hypothetical protein